MFCSKCGTQIPDGSAFCGNCGASVAPQQPQGNPYQYNQAPQQPPQAPQAPQGNPYQHNQAPQQPPQAPYGQPYGFAPQQSPYGLAPIGMKWFKFLIYFALFAGGILNILGGITILNGSQYGSALEAKLVYAFFPNLKTIDIIFGIVCIALGIFQIYVRFQLASFKAKAPQYITIMYLITGISTAIYSFVVAGMIPDVLSDYGSQLVGQGVGGLIGAGILVWLNKIYFNKRKHLFIN